ncbi:uncharacterized protein yc1106_08917 [Curvularia clavata]|uniref:Uncharacterized protein n=1 Tax=Curvularia clavata TaxID=95742 RepID=A0A9Q8ZJ45_CURCL|nr:uncharacterized protein yc1106_08917 [Curvularia clavata]
MDQADASKKRPTDRTKEAVRAEKVQKRLRGEGYPRVRDGKSYMTLESLQCQLSECQQKRDNTAAHLPDLIQERNRLLAAKDQNALKIWQQNAGAMTTRQYRLNEHNTLKAAQMLLEDFLYYQNAAHRRGRASIIQPKSNPPTWDLSGRRGTYMMNESANPPQTEDIVDAFDGCQIGGPLHRQGLMDWNGELIAVKASGSQPKLVRPNELLLWTPVCRRVPVGFGVTENEPLTPTRLQLDADAISEKCRRIEESTLRDEGLSYQTHAQRRRQELEMYRGDKPNFMTTADRFNRMRTREGVFISALESSYDWHTSYDSLGPVCDSIHPNFTISAERETIDVPDEDPAQDPEGSEAHSGPFQAIPKPTPSRKRKTPKRSVLSTRKPSRKAVIRPRDPQVPVTIDYPYPGNEFKDSSQERWPRLITETDRDRTPISTAGREEVYGRREWHNHMAVTPVSSANSLPHTMSEQPNRNRVAYQGKGKARAESGVEYCSPNGKDVQRNRQSPADSEI